MEGRKMNGAKLLDGWGWLVGILSFGFLGRPTAVVVPFITRKVHLSWPRWVGGSDWKNHLWRYSL